MKTTKTNNLTIDDVSSIKLSSIIPPYLDLGGFYMWTLLNEELKTLAYIICSKNHENDKICKIEHFLYESALEDSDILEKFLFDFFQNIKTFADLDNTTILIPADELMSNSYFKHCFMKYVNNKRQ
jgi:hypothetical protein